MTAPQVWFDIFLVPTVTAFVILVGIGAYWRSVGRNVSDWWAKVAAKVIQLPVLIVSGYATYATAKRDEWFPVAVVGGICIALWEVASLLLDSRVKAAEKQDKKTLAAAELECERRTELLTAFRKAVNDKVRRLMRALPKRTAKPSPTLIRRALTPDTHLDDLLQNLAVFFWAQLPEDQAPVRNFRVGLYAQQGETMVPLRAVNHNNPGYNVFSSHHQHEASFRLNATEKRSHVVNCVRQKSTMIVEDCIDAAARGEFHFFNDDQRGYLRSMMAYYLGEVCTLSGTMTVAALVIDTDAPGFFSEANRDSLEFCLREFGARLKLELLLDSILAEREKPDEHDG